MAADQAPDTQPADQARPEANSRIAVAYRRRRFRLVAASDRLFAGECLRAGRRGRHPPGAGGDPGSSLLSAQRRPPGAKRRSACHGRPEHPFRSLCQWLLITAAATHPTSMCARATPPSIMPNWCDNAVPASPIWPVAPLPGAATALPPDANMIEPSLPRPERGLGLGHLGLCRLLEHRPRDRPRAKRPSPRLHSCSDNHALQRLPVRTQLPQRSLARSVEYGGPRCVPRRPQPPHHNRCDRQLRQQPGPGAQRCAAASPWPGSGASSWYGRQKPGSADGDPYAEFLGLVKRSDPRQHRHGAAVSMNCQFDQTRQQRANGLCMARTSVWRLLTLRSGRLGIGERTMYRLLPSSSLKLLQNDRIIGLSRIGLEKIRSRRNQIAAQQVGISAIIQERRRFAHQPTASRYAWSAKIEARQVIVACGQADPGGGVFRRLLHRILEIPLRHAEIRRD